MRMRPNVRATSAAALYSDAVDSPGFEIAPAGGSMSAISRRHFIGSAAAASAIPLIGSSAHAQQTDWPNRAIKIIAGYPAGGQTDLFARTYGEHIRAETGQSVTVENKAGASGSVAAV